MARKLSLKQRTLLSSYTEYFDYDDLPATVRAQLVADNDYETMWQDVNRFLGDQYTAHRIASKDTGFRN